MRDATEQKEALETARKQDQQLRSIVESVRDYAIYLLDRDGNVITWSPGAERIKGDTRRRKSLENISRASLFRKTLRADGRPN